MDSELPDSTSLSLENCREQPVTGTHTWASPRRW